MVTPLPWTSSLSFCDWTDSCYLVLQAALANLVPEPVNKASIVVTLHKAIVDHKAQAKGINLVSASVRSSLTCD
jgi:hypothetical protein